MISTDVTVTVAEVAIVTTRLVGSALTVTIGGAILEAMAPGVQNRVLSRTWAGTVKALRFALRLFILVTGWPIRTAYGLTVTYVHVGARKARHTLVTRGRHRPEYVKTHRASAWQARGMVTA